MLGAVRSKLTFANVTSCIALFVALGGASYAAISLPKNSVGTAQLKNAAVTPRKVAGSTVALFKGKTGNPGPVGAPGPTGAQGVKGDPGATNLKVRAASGTGSVTASCQTGERATGGGAHSFGGYVTASAPAADPNAIYTTGGITYQEYTPTTWTAAAKTSAGNPADVTAWVVCAAP